MKNLVWLLALAFAGTVLAEEAKTTAPAKPAAHSTKAAAPKTHDVDAEIVAVDETAKTITIKGDPDNKTVPVQGKAVAALKTHKAGDKVTLVCLDNDKGEHQAVVAIKPAKAAPATH
jgi:ribosomal protein S1